MSAVVAVKPLYLAKPDAAAFLSLSVSTFEGLVAANDAPKPRQVSKGRVAWLVEDLEAWGRQRPAANMLPPPDSGHGRNGKNTEGQRAGTGPTGAQS